jgi:hypothetical protein
MLLAIACFALGLQTQRWFDRREVRFAKLRWQAMREHEQQAFDNYDLELNVLREKTWERQREFEVEMSKMKEMLEEAWEAERGVRQQLANQRSST